ncbi:conserved hypothetical protein [Methanocella arvoryzae MRE50]|uniref:IS1 family transposase n=1 Tax=Methanocella arvoryzae (strain DSM 22066 / NBRC 105507 / MRE50) TaxID=351160 RepID=Q0W4F0_METAR|nr:conserved hypothetical protein [Methanocella arvoryzae MRE50]
MGLPIDCGIRPACQNDSCEFYLKSEGSRVVKKGFSRAGHQVFQCRHCGRHFCETINTPMYGRRITREDVILIGKLLNERNGIRAIERITGHHRDTVMRVAKDLARHAEFLSSVLGDGLSSEAEHEVDEMWTFVQKKKSISR